MYEGSRLEKSNAALLFLHSRPNMKFRKIDGKPVNFIYDGRILEFAPGKHTFEVELSTYRAYGTGFSITYTPNYLIGSYALEVDLKPGYTYALDFGGINVHTLPFELCLMGEPHDAPGSSVNLTGEFRRMSPTVERFGCAKAFRTRQNTAE